jgi:hypothetical protein
VGLGGNFSSASGIEQIVNATANNSQLRILASWQANSLDFSAVALIGGNILIDSGDGNDVVVGTANADRIRGGRDNDSLDGGGGGDTYLVSGYDPNWYANQPYTFEGYDTYNDSGTSEDGIDQILATGSGPVDVGLGGNFSSASGIEQIVNATANNSQLRILASWEANVLDFSSVALIGTNILIDSGDGNDDLGYDDNNGAGTGVILPVLADVVTEWETRGYDVLEISREDGTVVEMKVVTPEGKRVEMYVDAATNTILSQRLDY